LRDENWPGMVGLTSGVAPFWTRTGSSFYFCGRVGAIILHFLPRARFAHDAPSQLIYVAALHSCLLSRILCVVRGVGINQGKNSKKHNSRASFFLCLQVQLESDFSVQRLLLDEVAMYVGPMDEWAGTCVVVSWLHQQALLITYTCNSSKIMLAGCWYICRDKFSP
jgi:hypothetical protein